jgi:hypothetical protein
VIEADGAVEMDIRFGILRKAFVKTDNGGCPHRRKTGPSVVPAACRHASSARTGQSLVSPRGTVTASIWSPLVCSGHDAGGKNIISAAV